jgi:hypothetical protein
MLKYLAQVTPNGITVVFVDGNDTFIDELHTSVSDTNYQKVLEIIKKDKLARVEGPELFKLMDKTSQLKQKLDNTTFKTIGNITLTRDGVMLNNEPLHGTMVDRIIQFHNEELPVEPLLRCLEKLMLNPSKASVDSFYDYVEANKVVIHEDGDFLAWKIVSSTYKDLYTGTVDNSVGSNPKMPRNQVDDNRNNTCSKGYHVCARGYLYEYGNGSRDKVVLCKVNPKDVVAVPPDYRNAKMRVCEYHVVGELSDKKAAELFEELSLARPSLADIDRGVTWGEDFIDSDYDEDYLDDEEDNNYLSEGDEELCDNPDCNCHHNNTVSGC